MRFNLLEHVFLILGYVVTLYTNSTIYTLEHCINYLKLQRKLDFVGSLIAITFDDR